VSFYEAVQNPGQIRPQHKSTIPASERERERKKERKKGRKKEKTE
jgi:hypothetical protein